MAQSMGASREACPSPHRRAVVMSSKDSGYPISVTKNEPEPKLFGPDTFRWGKGLPREGWGAKS